MVCSRWALPSRARSARSGSCRPLQEGGSWYAELLARRDEVDDSLAWAKVLHGSALQLWALGEVSRAAALEESAVSMSRSAGETRARGTAGVAFALAGLGEVAAGRGQPHRAGQLFGAGQALLPEANPLLRVIVPYDLPATLAAARAAGDPEVFDRGVAEGQAWTIDQAIAAGVASAAGPDTDLG